MNWKFNSTKAKYLQYTLCSLHIVENTFHCTIGKQFRNTVGRIGPQLNSKIWMNARHHFIPYPAHTVHSKKIHEISWMYPVGLLYD